MQNQACQPKLCQALLFRSLMLRLSRFAFEFRIRFSSDRPGIAGTIREEMLQLAPAFQRLLVERSAIRRSADTARTSYQRMSRMLALPRVRQATRRVTVLPTSSEWQRAVRVLARELVVPTLAYLPEPLLVVEAQVVPHDEQVQD